MESTVFEGLDLVRRVLPYLRREFSGMPENSAGKVSLPTDLQNEKSRKIKGLN